VSLFMCIEYLFERAHCAFVCLDAVLESGQVLLVALAIGAEFAQRRLVADFECGQAALKVGVAGLMAGECPGEFSDDLLEGVELRQGLVEARLQICEQAAFAGSRARSSLPLRTLRFRVPAAAAFPAGHGPLRRC